MKSECEYFQKIAKKGEEKEIPRPFLERICPVSLDPRRQIGHRCRHSQLKETLFPSFVAGLSNP